MAKLVIQGVIPPMLTPFDVNGDIDYEKHVRNLQRWNSDDLAGYVVLGSNSEAAYLSETEKLRLIETTVAHAATGRILVAGTGMESARFTIQLTNQAARLGVHAALVLTPSYYADQMTTEALIAYFTEVAEHSEIPILLYNVPRFTHVNISAEAVGHLSRHPNIIGIKDSHGDVAQLAQFQRVAAEDFNLMVGTASVWYPALVLGIRAGIMALANIAPNQCSEAQRAVMAGDHARAREIYLRLLPVNKAVTTTYGIAGLKYAADLTGYEGGCVRLPLLPLTAEEQTRLKEILARAGLLVNEVPGAPVQ